MHPSMEIVFSHLTGGLLWLSADGAIKFANAKARQLSGFEAGQRLPECTLKKAVAVIGSGRHPKPIEMEYLPPAGEARLLRAQAAPALTAGEVFVFLDEAAPHGEPLALGGGTLGRASVAASGCMLLVADLSEVTVSSSQS